MKGSLSLVSTKKRIDSSSIIPPHALPPEVKTDEVIQMSKSGIPFQTIINKIDSSYTVYHLSSQDVVSLKEAGVSFEVIDFMLSTEKRDILEKEEARWRYVHSQDGYWY